MCYDIQWIIWDVSWEITRNAHKNADLEKHVFQSELLTAVLDVPWDHVSFVTLLGKNRVVIVHDGPQEMLMVQNGLC